MKNIKLVALDLDGTLFNHESRISRRNLDTIKKATELGIEVVISTGRPLNGLPFDQIKGSGIGTSATRAEILKKLQANKYIALNKKTQVLTPTHLGEMIFDVVNNSIRSLLNPELTASWEKGLTYVAQGTITSEEYMEKLEGFIKRRTDAVLGSNSSYALRKLFDESAVFYKKQQKPQRRLTGGKKDGNM